MELLSCGYFISALNIFFPKLQTYHFPHFSPRQIVHSNQGLLTTVAFQLGCKAPITYAVEGSIAVAGQMFKWLRDNLNLLQSLDEIESLVTGNEKSSPHCAINRVVHKEKSSAIGGSSEVVFVPAFSGLYAPYWQKDARSIICGLTEDTSKGTSCCFQMMGFDYCHSKSGVPIF